MKKCDCGYEIRFPGESEMLEKWGCAKAVERRSGPFNSLEVTQCSSQTGDPEIQPFDDGSAMKEAFAQKYTKPEKPKDDADRKKL